MQAVCRHLRAPGLWALLLSGWVPMTAAGAPPATVSIVSDAGVPTVRIEPVGQKSLMIPACRGVVWQRFDQEQNRYAPVTKRPCGVMAPGIVVPAQGKTFAIDGKIKDGDVVRAVVVTGLECTVGQPFELADCATVAVVEGSTMTVRGVAD